MIDGIAYFTNAICVPSGELEGIPYFTNGLLIPIDGTQVPNGGGGIQWARISRERFVKKAKRDAEDINVLLTLLSIAERENE
jgi:hypothetical protein